MNEASDRRNQEFRGYSDNIGDIEIRNVTLYRPKS